MYIYNLGSKEIKHVFAEQFAKTLFPIRNKYDAVTNVLSPSQNNSHVACQVMTRIASRLQEVGRSSSGL